MSLTLPEAKFPPAVTSAGSVVVGVSSVPA